MFQPVGVKTLLKIRSPLPERPSTTKEEATSLRENGIKLEELHRPPTAPPALGQRTADHLREADQLSALAARIDHEEESIAEAEATQDLPGLLSDTTMLLQQLQKGWEEERRVEIDQLWSQCETEYGITLARDVPGTPALGSLRARAGHGAAGLLGSVVSGTLKEAHLEEAALTASSVSSPAEAEMMKADEVTEGARRDLEASLQLRKRMEAKLAARRCEAVEADSAVQALTERAAGQGEADARRLVILQKEVERLRAKSEALSNANAAPTGLGSTEATAQEADAAVLPIGVTAAAMAAAPLMAPELGDLNEWMEDLRVLSNETLQDLQAPLSLVGEQGRVKAVASPMRVRNACGPISPTCLSPPMSPSKKDMARLAEQRALDWAAGRPAGCGNGGSRSRSGQLSPSRRSPKTPCHGTLLAEGTDLLATRDVAPVLKEPASAIERQLDDILKELDEIDRIHDDVCMLAHA